MADAKLPTPEAFAKIKAMVVRLQNQLTNLKRQRVAPRHNAGGAGGRFIEFRLDEELRRGDTKNATHLPWSNEREIEDLTVIEKNKLSSLLKAPAGTEGYAQKTPLGWIITNLDCDALMPIDEDV